MEYKEPIGEPTYRRRLSKENTSVIDVISYLQRTSVTESQSGGKMDKNLFTVRHTFDFFYAGAKISLLDILFFFILICSYLMVYAMNFYGKPLKSFSEMLFLYLPPLLILITTCLLCYIARFAKGDITKRGVRSLLTGRNLSFFIFATMFLVFLYILAYNLQNYSFNDRSYIVRFAKVDQYIATSVLQKTSEFFYTGGWVYPSLVVFLALTVPILAYIFRARKIKLNSLNPKNIVPEADDIFEWKDDKKSNSKEEEQNKTTEMSENKTDKSQSGQTFVSNRN